MLPGPVAEGSEAVPRSDSGIGRGRWEASEQLPLAASSRGSCRGLWSSGRAETGLDSSGDAADVSRVTSGTEGSGGSMVRNSLRTLQTWVARAVGTGAGSIPDDVASDVGPH